MFQRSLALALQYTHEEEGWEPLENMSRDALMRECSEYRKTVRSPKYITPIPQVHPQVELPCEVTQYVL